MILDPNMFLDENGEPDFRKLVHHMLSKLEEVRELDPVYYNNRVQDIKNVLGDLLDQAAIIPDASSLEQLISDLPKNYN